MRKLDLTGQKFNRLTVLEEVPKAIRNHIKPVWKCQCDCGNLTLVPTDKLKSNNTRSCGCSRKERSSNHLSRVAKANRKYSPREASARGVYNSSYRDGNISFNDFYTTLSQQDCFYCERKPFMVKGTVSSNHTQGYLDTCHFTYTGLDRLDNSKPHNLDNVVPACYPCNIAKNEMTPRQFYELIQAIANKLKEKTIDQIRNQIDIPSKDTIAQMMITQGLYKDGKPTRVKTIYFDRVYCKEYRDGDIDFYTFFYLTQQNCSYCNGKPSNFRRITNDLTIYHSGLDRIDSTQPHILSNVLPSCKWCNFAKGRKSFDEFKAFIELLHATFTLEKVEYLERCFIVSEPLSELDKDPLKPRKRKKYPRKPTEKKNHPPGSQPGMVGYKFPDAIKQKMSDIAQTTNRSKGEKNHKATITEEQAIEIKTLLLTHNPRQVSDLIKVPLRIVRRIAYGETWTHILLRT